MKSSPHVDEIAHGRVLEVDFHGKLSREDYEKVMPDADRLIRQHGKIRVLATMREFEGWDASAWWEDLKWETKRFADIERLAIPRATPTLPSWSKPPAQKGSSSRSTAELKSPKKKALDRHHFSQFAVLPYGSVIHSSGPLEFQAGRWNRRAGRPTCPGTGSCQPRTIRRG